MHHEWLGEDPLQVAWKRFVGGQRNTHTHTLVFLPEQPNLDKVEKDIAGRGGFFQVRPGHKGTWAVPSSAAAFPESVVTLQQGRRVSQRAEKAGRRVSWGKATAF